MHTIALEIAESKHCFRINGITLATRHLNGMWSEPLDDRTALYRFLACVNVIATEGETKVRNLNYRTKYILAKSKKLWEKLNIPKDAEEVFREEMAKKASLLEEIRNFLGSAIISGNIEQELEKAKKFLLGKNDEDSPKPNTLH